MWYYPGRQDCLVCHTARAGLVLGVNTRQMNRDFDDPSGRAGNQLLAWNRLGLFEPALDEARLGDYPRWRGPTTPDAVWRTGPDRIWTPIAPTATAPAAPWPISTRATTRR